MWKGQQRGALCLQAENPADRPPFEDIVLWLRKLYDSCDSAGRDNRRSLDLNPWATN